MADLVFGTARNEVWERLEEILARASRSGEISLLLNEEALRAARDLAAATDPARDLDAACTLAGFHWNRYLVLPRGRDRPDFDSAFRYFALIFPVAPGRVPEQLRGHMGKALHRGLKRADLFQVGDRIAECFADFQRTGLRERLFEAAGLQRYSAAVTPAGDVNHVARRANLAAVLLEVFQALRWPDVLVEARELTLSVLDLLPDADPTRVIVLNNLGSIERGIYEFSDDLDDLRSAEARLRQAVASAAPDDSNLPLVYVVLCDCLRLLAERAGDGAEALLGEAVTAGRRAVDGLPSDHPRLAHALSNLSLAQWAQALPSADAAALRSAAATARRAVDAAPRGSIEPSAMLSNLGAILQNLYQCTHEAEILEEAVRAGREAVGAAPLGHPLRARQQANLALACSLKADATGESADFHEAVTAAETALAAVGPGDPALGTIANNLALALFRSYLHTGEMDALVRAFDRCREAVEAIPPDRPVRVSALSNASLIATSLYELYDDFGPAAVAAGLAGPDLPAETAVVIEAAVELGREAVAVMRPDHPDRGKFLGNLALALHRQYGRTHEPALQAEAVEFARRAVDAVAPGHPDRSAYLNNLGDFLCVRADLTESPALRADAYAAYTEASGIPTASAELRIAAYRNAASLDLEAGRPAPALEALEQAIALVPLLASRGLIRIDRERAVRRLAGLAQECCAAALAAGRPEYAVELLEQTRGLLSAEQIDAASSDLARLRAAHPDLAEEITTVRERVAALGAAQPGFSLPFVVAEGGRVVGEAPRFAAVAAIGAVQSLAAERREAHERWQELVEQIRARQGFESFLRAPRFEDLAAAATDGPVVFLCAHRTAGNALIITGGHTPAVRVLDLPALDETSVLDRARRMLAALDATQSDDPDAADAAQPELTRLLAWLWDAVAEPVLTALGLRPDARPQAQAQAQPPRVWWCPVGILALLPIHAAERGPDTPSEVPGEAPGPPGCMMDAVTSSYTATLRGLLHTRVQAPDPSARSAGSALVVCVVEAQDQLTLGGAQLEAREVAELLPGSLLLTDPTRREVRDALPGHRIAHFACHAAPNGLDAGASHLVLADHAQSPLTVREISALNLTADLAFLSACQTTITTPALADEPVHITGAFQLAGFRSVVGTLWPVIDPIAARVTRSFYLGLTAQGTEQPAVERAAVELHQAVRALRKRHRDAPTAWAGYIHTGV